MAKKLYLAVVFITDYVVIETKKEIMDDTVEHLIVEKMIRSI